MNIITSLILLKTRLSCYAEILYIILFFKDLLAQGLKLYYSIFKLFRFGSFCDKFELLEEELELPWVLFFEVCQAHLKLLHIIQALLKFWLFKIY